MAQTPQTLGTGPNAGPPTATADQLSAPAAPAAQPFQVLSTLEHTAGPVLLKPVTAQTPWYRNPVAVMGYVAQVFGLLFVLASVLVTVPVPGLPQWVLTAAGVVVAVGAKYGLDQHSATVRAAELATSGG